jgi:hypothetical protein
VKGLAPEGSASSGKAAHSDALSARYDAVFGRLDRLEHALRTEIQAQTDRAETAEARLRALGDLTLRADELVAAAQSEAARLSREARYEFDLASKAHQEAEELRAEAQRLTVKAAAEHASALQQLAAAPPPAAAHEATPAQPTAETLAPVPDEDLLLAIRRYLTDMLTLEEVTVATAGTVDHLAGGIPRLSLLRSDRRSGDDEEQRHYDEDRANR